MCVYRECSGAHDWLRNPSGSPSGPVSPVDRFLLLYIQKIKTLLMIESYPRGLDAGKGDPLGSTRKDFPRLESDLRSAPGCRLVVLLKVCCSICTPAETDPDALRPPCTGLLLLLVTTADCRQQQQRQSAASAAFVGPAQLPQRSNAWAQAAVSRGRPARVARGSITMEADLYQELGVGRSASDKEIKNVCSSSPAAACTKAPACVALPNAPVSCLRLTRGGA